MLLLEFPHISKKLAVYARKNGEYRRPIRGSMMDLRTENMGIQAAQRERRLMNLIAKLPDIPEAGQHGVYLVTTFGGGKLESDPNVIDQLIKSNKYFPLPDSPESEFWHLTKAPWWEFTEVLDEYGGPIKAAPFSTTEFTPDSIDEKLDEYPENQGRLDVLSPATLEKMARGELKESYLKKLARIT
jgi:hypothetical protein